MSNLKFGRWGKIISLTLSRRISSWPRLESKLNGSKWGGICKYERCFISIMKSPSNSNCGTDLSWLLRVNRCNWCHLLSTDKTSSMDGPLHQIRVTSVIFSAGSNSAKSVSTSQVTLIRSISTWRQLLTIYEEVSSVGIIIEAINFTSFRSLELEVVTFSFFSFFRRPISLRKLSWLGNSICKSWMFEQAERIHLTSAEIEKSCDFKMKLIFIISVTSRDLPNI